MSESVIIGGARSGKSTLAEKRAHDSGSSVICVATARLDDGDMSERCQQRRVCLTPATP